MKNFYAKYKLIVNALILALVPILACFIRTLLDHKGLGDVFIASGEWNDEQFYFKQIECMVRDTIPKGYFGYNESAAKVLSFGTWSPVILIPWAIWGKLFGWTLMSPIIANIVFLTIALFVFAILAKPDFKQTLFIFVLLMVTTPLTRYLLSSMCEIVCLVPIVILMGLVCGYNKGNHKKLRYTFMYICLVFMTLMRPYYVLFFAFPFFAEKKNKWSQKSVSAIIAILSLVAYFIVMHFLTSSYIGSVYNTAWLDTFATDGFFKGIAGFFKYLISMLRDILLAGIGGARGGYPQGIYFAGFLFVLLIYIIETMRLLTFGSSYGKWALSMMLVSFGILFAMAAMYSIQDGFRHLMIFIVAGIILLPFLEHRVYIEEVVTAAALIWLFVIKASNPLYFDVVYKDSNPLVTEEKLEMISDELSKAMTVTDELSWDNTLDIVFLDTTVEDPEGDLVTLNWQFAYGAPEGIAISICIGDFVCENIDSLNSRYIMVQNNSRVQGLLESRSATKIAGNELVSFYKLR